MKSFRRVRVALFLLTMLAFIPSQVIRAEESEASTVYYMGETYYVDEEAGTITYDGQTYNYNASGDADNYTVDIEYPNGEEYYYKKMEGAEVGGFQSHMPNLDGFVSEENLVYVATAGLEKPKEEKNWILKIGAFLVLGGIGVATCMNPEAMWYAEEGWKFRNAEPSDDAITFTRIGGVLLIIGAFAALILL